MQGGTPQPTPEAHGGRSSAERTERAASSMGHVRPESVTAASTSSSEATDVPGLREEIDLVSRQQFCGCVIMQSIFD